MADELGQVSRETAERAYTEAVRTAGRASLMSVLGFGLALVTGVSFAREGTLLVPGFGLDAVLFAGGLGGGLVFSILALRASRIARRCEQARREGTSASRR